MAKEDCYHPTRVPMFPCCSRSPAAWRVWVEGSRLKSSEAKQRNLPMLEADTLRSVKKRKLAEKIVLQAVDGCRVGNSWLCFSHE